MDLISCDFLHSFVLILIVSYKTAFNEYCIPGHIWWTWFHLTFADGPFSSRLDWVGTVLHCLCIDKSRLQSAPAGPVFLIDKLPLQSTCVDSQYIPSRTWDRKFEYFVIFFALINDRFRVRFHCFLDQNHLLGYIFIIFTSINHHFREHFYRFYIDKWRFQNTFSSFLHW